MFQWKQTLTHTRTGEWNPVQEDKLKWGGNARPSLPSFRFGSSIPFSPTLIGPNGEQTQTTQTFINVTLYVTLYVTLVPGERWTVQRVQHADHRRPVADEGLGERRPVGDETDGGEPHQQPQLHLQGECPLQRPAPQVVQMLNLCANNTSETDV